MKFNLFLLFLIINSIVVLAVPSLLTQQNCSVTCEACGKLCCSSNSVCLNLIGPGAYCEFHDNHPCITETGGKCGICSR